MKVGVFCRTMPEEPDVLFHDDFIHEEEAWLAAP